MSTALAYDEPSTDPLAPDNQRVLASIARRYVGRGLDLEDLVAYGQIGLLIARERYDGRPGVKFTTYATWWIEREIRAAVVMFGRPIRIPGDVLAELKHRTGRRCGSGEALAAARRLLEARTFRDGDMPDGTLADLVADHYGDPDPGLALDLAEILAGLPERQARVLSLRFGLDGSEPITLLEAARRVGVCAENVRQTQEKALEALRKKLTDPE